MENKLLEEKHQRKLLQDCNEQVCRQYTLHIYVGSRRYLLSLFAKTVQAFLLLQYVFHRVFYYWTWIPKLHNYVLYFVVLAWNITCSYTVNHEVVIISAAQYTGAVIKPRYKIRTPSHFLKLPILLCCIKVPASIQAAVICLLLVI